MSRLIRGPWIGLTAADRHPGEPPTVEYLAERSRLNMPSHAAALLHRCPWCDAAIYHPCVIKATGWRLTHTHEERQQLAEDPS